MSEIHYAREPNRWAIGPSAEETIATRQLAAAMGSDENLAGPAELLLASVTDDDLQYELGILRRSWKSKGFSQQAQEDLAGPYVRDESLLRSHVAAQRATLLIFNLGKICETPDEIFFMANLWNNPTLSELNVGFVPSQHDVFHLGIKVADSQPKHAVGVGAAVASMVRPPRSRYYDYDRSADTEVGFTEIWKEYKRASENGSDGVVAYLMAYAQNKPLEKLGTRITLSEITRILSVVKIDAYSEDTLGEMIDRLDAYKLGVLKPRRKKNDTLPQSSDFVRAAAGLSVNFINYLSSCDQSKSGNATKIKQLLDGQKVAHRDLLDSDLAFINIANGILRGNGSRTVLDKSIKSLQQALGIVVDAAIADSRLKDKNEYADLVRSCSNRLIEIAILRNNFLPKVTADTKAVPPGKVPAIKTTTRGEYRNSKDARTPGYGTIS